MVQHNITVIKRDGTSETLNLEKIHRMVEHACEGIAGVSASQVEMNSGLQFYDGIKTSDIQKILIRSAADLISLETPNYQYVAARLIVSNLYKEVFGGFEVPALKGIVEQNVTAKVYDHSILRAYTDAEWEELNGYIQHGRDMNFSYAGIRQIVDKYLVQDRTSERLYETPQIMYMMIAATLFRNYPATTRMKYVKAYYDAASLHKINLPTPIMAGVRTPLKQYSSCVLVDVGDDLNSIFSSDMAIGYYTAQRSGIGINAGRIRGLGSKIRDGEVVHTGVIPFLKKFESTVRCCTQNGVRGGNATVHFPIWHQEIEDILVLKNNKGTDDNRVRRMDYSIQISRLFYERLLANENVTLFSPHVVPGLYDVFGLPEFDALYTKYEQDESIPKKTIRAMDLFSALMRERMETGRIYIMNIDHANEHGSFLDHVAMSNLCLSGDSNVSVRGEDGLETIISIKELTERHEKGEKFWVLSHNTETAMDVYSAVSAAAKTGHNRETLTIEDDNGYVLVCTPEHEVYTKNRGYVPAKELKEDDILQYTKAGVVGGLKITYNKTPEDVYDITVPETSNFYANDILVHNCQEVLHPTKPISHIDDVDGLIGVCVLSALNLGTPRLMDEIEHLADLIVRGLDEVIDLQEYPVKAAEKFTRNYRSLGVGYINTAYFLAKNKVKYSDPKAAELIGQVTERFMFAMLKASVQLSKEKGPAPYFYKTKYARGILPIDTYKKDIDAFVPKHTLDWEGLRSDIMCYGLRHSTFGAIMPSESSSVVSNATNGIEPPRDFISVKKSKKGTLKQVVPSYERMKNHYELLWDMPDMDGYLRIAAAIQKYYDMGISVNTSYNPENFPDKSISMSVLLKDLLTAYKYGLKNLYYQNTMDGKMDAEEDVPSQPAKPKREMMDCESGACAI